MADKIVSWGGFDSKGTSGMGVTGSLGVIFTTTTTVHGEGNTLLQLRGINGSSPGSNDGRLHIGYNQNDPELRLNSGGISVSTGKWTFLPQIWFAGGITSTHNTAFTLDGMTNGVTSGTAGDIIKFTQRSGQFASFYDAGNGLSEFRVWQQANSNNYIYLKPGQTSIFNLSPVTVKGSGTTSSTTSLLVQDSAGTEYFKLTDDAALTFTGLTRLSITTATQINSRLVVFNTNGSSGGYSAGYDFKSGYGGSDGNTAFRIWSTFGISRVAIGNVAENTIGNSNSKLYIDNTESGGRNKGIKLNVNFANISTEYNGIQFDTIENGSGGAFVGSQYNTSASSYGSDLVIFTTTESGAGSYTETARFVGKSQSLSIGAGKNPTATLHVSGSSNSALFEIDSPTQNNILYVSGSGRVGIGTGTPNYKLDVSGSSNFTGNMIITGSLSISGGPITPTSNIARGAYFNNSITSTNNSDIIIGLDINPLFSGNNSDWHTLRLWQPINEYGDKRPYISWKYGDQYDVFRMYMDANWRTIFKNTGQGSQRGFAFSGGNVEITGSTSNSLLVKGSGTTSSTTALLVQNANASASLQVKDDGSIFFGTGSITYGPTSGPGAGLKISLVTSWASAYPVSIGNLNTLNGYVVGGVNQGAGGGYVLGDSNTVNSGTGYILGGGNTQNTYNGTHIMIGWGNTSDAYTNTQNASIIIGQQNNTNGYYGGGLIGSNIRYYANNQLAFGTNSSNVDFGIREIYFGYGVRNIYDGINSGHGPNISINTSQAYSGSAALNRNGGSLSLRGGQGTGTGSAGDVIFATATTGSDGATYHSYSNRVWVKGHTGFVGVGISTPSASLHVSGTVLINNILTLTPQDPLPTGVGTGSFAVSSSVPPKPYFYDGTSWNALY